jgi:2'-5' RNA ligase
MPLLHITLAYLGDTSDPVVAGNYFHCKQVLDDIAARMPPITGMLNGIGRFHQDEGDRTQALWAAFDAPELPGWRQRLVEALSAFSVPVANNHGFTPHVTLAYIPMDAQTPHIDLPTDPLTFDRLTLCWGDDRQEWRLRGAIAKAETVTTDTGLVADDRAVKRKRKRGKRKPVDVGALIESEAAGALDWAKKASEV